MVNKQFELGYESRFNETNSYNPFDVTKGTDFRRVVVTVKSKKPAKRQACSHEHPWPVTSTEFSSLVLGLFLTLKKIPCFEHSSTFQRASHIFVACFLLTLRMFHVFYVFLSQYSNISSKICCLDLTPNSCNLFKRNYVIAGGENWLSDLGS